MQGDQKSLWTWWLQYRKLQVMFKVSLASLQTFIDMPNCVFEDRVQYSTVHIPIVFCDGHLQLIRCVGTVRIHWVRCTETFCPEFQICLKLFKRWNKNLQYVWKKSLIKFCSLLRQKILNCDWNFWSCSDFTAEKSHNVWGIDILSGFRSKGLAH